MEKLTVSIRIPEHFHAEDALANLLNDDGMLEDLKGAIASAIEEWVRHVVEGIGWRDCEVEIKRA